MDSETHERQHAHDRRAHLDDWVSEAEMLEETFGDRDARIAALQHAIDLKDATINELARQVEGLRTSRESRAVIEQAKGVIMAAMRCPPERAFELLVDQSMRQNEKLRDIAQSIVDVQNLGDLDPPSPA